MTTPPSPPPELQEDGNTINADDFVQRIQVVEDRNKPFHPAVAALLTFIAHTALSLFIAFSYIRAHFRRVLYNLERKTLFSNRTPQQIRLDVKQFPKIPKHIAFVLNKNQQVEQLIEQSAECLSWVLGVGAKQLTIYERSGQLKQVELSALHAALKSFLTSSLIAGDMPELVVRKNKEFFPLKFSQNAFLITFQSEDDGRQMLVELANDYKEKVEVGKLKADEITVSKVHDAVVERVGDEPDLLVTFTSHLDVDQFSPWLLRVTELFCLPDNNNVFHYLVFYRALEKFANVKVNLGA